MAVRNNAVRLRAARSLTRELALRLPCAPDAAASTAFHPTLVTIATRPSDGMERAHYRPDSDSVKENYLFS